MKAYRDLEDDEEGVEAADKWYKDVLQNSRFWGLNLTLLRVKV